MTKTTIDTAQNIFDILNIPEITTTYPVYLNTKPTGATEKKYIVVKPLVVAGGQLQQGVVMVNIHAANVEASINSQPQSNIPDNISLKAMQTLVIPLIEDAVFNDMGTEIQTVTTYEEPELREHFLNIRVLIHYINLN